MEDPNVPQEVTTGAPIGNDRATIFAKDKEHEEFFKKYGESNGFSFFLKAGSDGAFAVRAIQDLLGYFEPSVAPPVDEQSPQEENITGKVDHTGDVPEKEHVEGESEAPATNDVDDNHE